MDAPAVPMSLDPDLTYEELIAGLRVRETQERRAEAHAAMKARCYAQIREDLEALLEAKRKKGEPT